MTIPTGAGPAVLAVFNVVNCGVRVMVVETVFDDCKIVSLVLKVAELVIVVPPLIFACVTAYVAV